MSAARPTPAERAVAVAIFAPIGLGAKVVDDLPDAMVKARQQLVFARFIGKMAVDQGVRELRGRWGDLAHSDAAGAEARPDAEPAGDETKSSPSAETTEPLSAPGHGDLALPDYDQLPAAHIVGKLAGLTAAELDSIEAYESAHRHRRTVLGKISQLRGE